MYLKYVLFIPLNTFFKFTTHSLIRKNYKLIHLRFTFSSSNPLYRLKKRLKSFKLMYVLKMNLLKEFIHLTTKFDNYLRNLKLRFPYLLAIYSNLA